MDNYLDLIKNPKKKSTNTSTGQVNSQNRSSSSLSNQVPSSNPSYVNNLDVFKANQNQATNMRSANQDSNTLNQRSPAYNIPNMSNQINNNLYGAPQSQSPLSNQRIQNSNVYGVYGQAPSPANKNDGSVKTNLYGNQPLQTQAQTYRSPQAQNIYGTNLPQGGAYSQDRTNPIPVQTVETPKRSAYGSALRDSSEARRSQQMSSAPSVRNKRSSSKKNNEQTIYILCGVLAFFVSIFGLKLGFFSDSVVYCDTYQTNIPEGCEPCPNHGRCQGGKLIECTGKYKIYKNHCVLDERRGELLSNYRKYIHDRLVYYKGERMCDSSYPDRLSMDEVVKELRLAYPGDPYLKDTKQNDFIQMWREDFVQVEGLNQTGYSRNEYYTTEDEGYPSFTCKMKLLWKEGKLIGLWFLFFVSSALVSIKLIRRNMIYSKLGKELYVDVLDYLTYWKKISVKALKREFEQKYPDKDYERLWSYVEDLRKKEARIFQYNDNYQGIVQPFWLYKD